MIHQGRGALAWPNIDTEASNIAVREAGTGRLH